MESHEPNAVAYRLWSADGRMVKLEPASFTDILQIALTLVGFCFVIYSIVQVNKTLRVSAHTAATVNLLELDKLFIENPKYWPYFHRGMEMAESDERYFQLLALADFVLDYFQALLQQAPHAWDSADTKPTVHQGNV